MAGTKYEHLIKPLSIGAIEWQTGQGDTIREFRLIGRDHLDGMGLNFSWGVHKEVGDWHPGLDPHVHPYPECMLFVGLDTANVKYLGAEIECCLGPEQEIYAFNEPTAIVIPAGLPHGPITTRRVYSPRGFGFWAIELSSLPDLTWMGEGAADVPAEERRAAPEGLKFATAEEILRNKPTAGTGKYAHLVKSLKSKILIERGKFDSSRFTPEELAEQKKATATGERPGPGNADHLVWMRGSDFEGLNVNIFWGFCSQPGIWRRGTGAHVHPADEILVYTGIDPDSGELGAELEIDMGKEHERHIISKPTVVVCPAGVPHMPQVSRWVDKPFAFFAVNLDAAHDTKAID